MREGGFKNNTCLLHRAAILAGRHSAVGTFLAMQWLCLWRWWSLQSNLLSDQPNQVDLFFYFDLFECFPTSLFLAISTVFPFFKVPTLTEETLLAGSLVLPATNMDTKEHKNEAHIQTNINYTPCSRLCGLDRVGEWPGSALFWALLLLRNMIRQLTIGARKQILQITSIPYRFIYGCDWLNEGPGSNHVIGLTVIFPDLTCVQGLICLYEIIFSAYIWYQKSSLSYSMSLFGIDAEAINPEVYDPHPPTAGFYQRITCQQEFCRIYKGSAALFINPKN